MKLYARVLIVAVILSSAGVCLAQEELPTETLARARKLVEQKDYDAALDEYFKIKTWLWERDPGLVIEYARVCTYADRHEDAVALFEELERQHPGHAKQFKKELRDQRGYIDLRAARMLVAAESDKPAAEKDYTKAIAAYEKMAEWLWTDPNLVIEWARVYTYANRHDEAVALFRKLQKRYPQRARTVQDEFEDQWAYATLNRARAIVDEQTAKPEADKDYSAAIAEYKSIDKWLWKHPTLAIEWARVHMYAGEHAEAVDVLEQLKRRHPDLADQIEQELVDQRAYSTLKEARKLVAEQTGLPPDEGDYEPAIAEYEKIADWLRRDPGLVVELARVYCYANRHQDAIKLFEEVQRTAPELTETFAKDLADQRAFLTLQSARDLIEQEEYEAALEEYGKITDWLMQRDPGLAIELARVHAYTDMHTEAIAIYEHVRENHPDYATEIYSEWGHQLIYSKDSEAALRVYDEALKQDPDNVDYKLGRAMALAWAKRYRQAEAVYDMIIHADPESVPALLGKANVLSWQDKLEEARPVYERVLEIEPGNLMAMNGLARLLVWEGHHRRGIDAYREILDDYPDNLDAREGLGFALHWDRQTQKAVDVFQDLLSTRPDRREAAKIMFSLQFSKNPRVSQYNRISKDRDNKRVYTHGATAGLRLDYDTWIAGIYEFEYVRDEDHGRVDGHRSGLHFRHRMSREWEFETFLLWTHFDRPGWIVFTTDTKLTWMPTDELQFRFGYERDTFRDPEAIMREIVTDGWTVSGKYRPNRWWLFGVNFRQKYFSDSNRQESVLALAEYRLMHDPYVKFYFNYYWASWQEQTGHGYFNPDRFESYTAGIYVSKKLFPHLFLEGQGSINWEFHHPTVRAAGMFLAGGVSYQFTPNLVLRTRAEYQKVWQDSDHAYNGYRRWRLYLSLAYTFGDAEDRVPRLFDRIRQPSPESR
ncbi:MAG: tetratricopeptide repeat protein [Planctomycetota bacterium]|jgi:tetratricopeptide (TPR) repeat protein